MKTTKRAQAAGRRKEKLTFIMWGYCRDGTFCMASKKKCADKYAEDLSAKFLIVPLDADAVRALRERIAAVLYRQEGFSNTYAGRRTFYKNKVRRRADAILKTLGIPAAGMRG